MADLDEKHINYKSVEEVTKEPGEGTWEVLVNRWWSYRPDKGLLFYKKSPQCNRLENIARYVANKCYPDAEIIFIPYAYLKHDCHDYI